MTAASELRRMIEAADAADRPVCLATVVDVDGSAYRRPGARMLVLPYGRRIGSISGGCLEAELCRTAPWLTSAGPRVVAFDTRGDADEPTPRYNLGCAGVIHVLVERVTGDDHCPLREARAVLATDEPRVVATVYATEGEGFPPIGARLPAASLSGALGPAAATAERVGATGRAASCELIDGPRACRMLIERIDPPRPLWVFGAGDDARAICAMAAPLGWNVTMIDTRPAPSADAPPDGAARRLRVVASAARAALRPNRRVAAVLVTHRFEDDVQLLPWLLASDVGYVGLLGPRARTTKILRRLAAAGRSPAPEGRARLHAPVGLDVGAAAPAEIALSILAEIVAHDAGRAGGRLSEREGPIHAPAASVLIDLTGPGRAAPATEVRS